MSTKLYEILKKITLSFQNKNETPEKSLLIEIIIINFKVDKENWLACKILMAETNERFIEYF